MKIRFYLTFIAVLLFILLPMAFAEERAHDINPLRNAYFGDLHVHTGFSWDAWLFGTKKTFPDDAYLYAKGEAIDFAGGKIQLKHGAMDFLAVTDHAEFLGRPYAEREKNPSASYYDCDIDKISKEFFWYLNNKFIPALNNKANGHDIVRYDQKVERAAWDEIVAAAERHYVPGRFTTFIGYEWTSAPGGREFHRNVIFRGSRVPDKPFSSFDSTRPEDLWNWMDGLRGQGIETLAIPHNSNKSGGLMFTMFKSDGTALDAESAAQRLRNEPIVEVTQVKGTSETNPALSPTDEWADFEIHEVPPKPSQKEKDKKTPAPNAPTLAGSYVRQAYKTGLKLSEQKGFNPYKFGMIGSTDTHSTGSCQEEDNFFGKVGCATSTPALRLLKPETKSREQGKEKWKNPDMREYGASGLAGVWAEENTREAIYDAIRRKECFATTGPRIRVRFFAGYDFPDDLDKHHNMVKKAYETGVSMGGDLLAQPNGKAPRMLVWATRDPQSAPLQRIQIVKGWMEAGIAREKVFDVAGSDGLSPEPVSHRIPDNGAKVDLKTGQWDEDKGAAELSCVWTDPEFDPRQEAFYYVRVLENPTLRWSTYDANTLGIPVPEDLPKTIQERAYTSPIWYSPKR